MRRPLMNHLVNGSVIGAALVIGGCSDVSFRVPPTVPPADPPGRPIDEQGRPPNWQDCFGGYVGTYSNMEATHPDIVNLTAPEDTDEPPPLFDAPFGLDWWDNVAFQRFDPNLDFGGSFYPVDEGFAGDPDYFAVKWTAWVRAWSNTDLDFLIATTSDAWVVIDGEVVASSLGLKTYEITEHRKRLTGGQYPIEVYYAHRGGQSGFRFRITGGDIKACYPAFDDSE